jgi:ankyrin repeat protein
MVTRLLQAGADVNAVVLADETALINASMRGDLAMVQVLLDAGAQINLQVETPLSDGRVIRSALNQALTSEMRAYLLGQGAR